MCVLWDKTQFSNDKIICAHMWHLSPLPQFVLLLNHIEIKLRQTIDWSSSGNQPIKVSTKSLSWPLLLENVLARANMGSSVSQVFPLLFLYNNGNTVKAFQIAGIDTK